MQAREKREPKERPGSSGAGAHAQARHFDNLSIARHVGYAYAHNIVNP